METKKTILQRFLTERFQIIPRPARLFLTDVAEDDGLLERMHFCHMDDRAALRNSVMVSTDGAVCWAVLFDNNPREGRERARKVIEGLDLSPAEILARLRSLPVWFLAIDPPFATPARGEAPAIERTLTQLAKLSTQRIRATAIHDQIDAALEAGDYAACRRLRESL